MKFSVDDPEMLSGIEVGQRVQGELVEQDGEYVTTKLEQE